MVKTKCRTNPHLELFSIYLGIVLIDLLVKKLLIFEIFFVQQAYPIQFQIKNRYPKGTSARPRINTKIARKAMVKA